MPLPQVDHIIYLVSLSELHSLPSIFSNFKILPGGRHADGATENRLVVFEDGIYLELIAFWDEERRKSHWWGSKEEGSVIDFAYTLPERATGDASSSSKTETSSDSTSSDIDAKRSAFTTIQTAVGRVSKAVHYNDAIAGGRIKPTGEVIKWKVAFPAAASGLSPLLRGEVPFWCFDETPRALRVPHQIEENVQHPCRAVGVAYICVMVPPSRVQELIPVYEQAHGKPGLWVTEGSRYGITGGYLWQSEGPAPGSKVDIILKQLEEETAGKGKEVKIKVGLWTRAADGDGLDIIHLE